MKIVTISKRKFNELEKLPLSNTIFNTEAVLYLFQDKSKWKIEKKTFKKLYTDEGDSFGNKLMTVNALIDNKEFIDIDELVMPEKLVAVDDQIVGFTMPYIENTNLSDILKDNSISNKIKIDYLKEIGSILNKMKKVREHGEIKDFYLNDLHEANFVLNHNTNKINVVDMDSCKINGNKPFVAKYLTPCSPISDMNNKYIINDEFKYPGYIVANENSDLFCYNVMILNYLYKDTITKLNKEEYYTYLQYLMDIDFPFDLVTSFSKIYEYTDNVNSMEYLEEIPAKAIFMANKTVYENYKTKKMIYTK